VLAYAKGEITLERLNAKARKDQIRYAPNFRTGLSALDSNAHPYTADSIARFLGWTQPDGQVSPRVRIALLCLEEAEEAAEAIVDDGDDDSDDGASAGKAKAKAAVADEYRPMTKGLGSSSARVIVAVVK
jgi:hypothetical protein